MNNRYCGTLLILLRYALLVEMALSILGYIYVALVRMSYPYELEWMEGGCVDHVRRILAGDQLYVKPSFEFIPFIYTPLYFYASATLSSIMGVGFFPLRFLSFLSSLGCFTVIFLFVRRETRDAFYGFLAAALFAAVYRIAGAWLDLARVDSLFLFLMLASVYALRSSESPASSIIAALLLAMSFLTKQSAVFLALPLSLYTILALKKWNKIVFPLVFFTLVGVSTALFDSASHGWFSYYVFFLPAQHGLKAPHLITFWIYDILTWLGIGFAFSLVYLIRLPVTAKQNDIKFFWLFFLGMIGLSWGSRLHEGGYDDVLLPAYAAIAICLSLGVHAVRSSLTNSTGAPPEPVRARKSGNPKASASREAPAQRPLFEILIVLLCLVQFLSPAYNPRDQIPTKADRQAGDEFIDMLKGIRGDVLIFNHGYLPSLAGKSTSHHDQGAQDVFRGTDAQLAAELRDEIDAAISSGRFRAIIVDSVGCRYMDAINANYRYVGPVFRDNAVFWPRTGFMTRPESLFMLRDSGGNQPL